MRTIVEGLLGVQRAYGGLRIKTAFPSDWNQAECTMRIRNVEYRINIKRCSNFSGEVSVKLNGVEVKNGFIPFFESGVYKVEVEV